MNEEETARSLRIYRLLAERAASFGAAVWHCRPCGEAIVTPDGATADGTAMACETARGGAKPSGSAGPRYIRVEDRIGSRCVAVNVAAIDTREPAAAHHADRLADVLNWSYQDATRREQDAQTIAQFSERLGQSYEETQVICRIARLLNGANDPVAALAAVVDEIHLTMPFAWLACRFTSDDHAVDMLRGKLLRSGAAPCDDADFDKHVAQSLALCDPRANGATAGVESPGLASATGAEMLRAPITHDGKIVGILVAGNKVGPDPALSSFETQFVEACAHFLGLFHENTARFAEQRSMFLGTLKALTSAIDAKDPYTRGHSERVSVLAEMTARSMGLRAEEVEQYRIAGLVHDVGKIGVPEAVLRKPGRLTEAEFEQIKLHPAIGFSILKEIPAIGFALPGVLHHHEHWSGRGYPHGLCGQNIPMLARVLTLADTFDAMSSTRAYRPAMPRQAVLAELDACSGKQFDPELTRIFRALDFAPFDRMIDPHTAPGSAASNKAA